MSAGVLGTATKVTLLLSPVSGHSIWYRPPGLIGSAAGHSADALPAAQSRSWLCPSAERSLSVTALSASGRHSFTLLASVTHTLPLCVTSMSQMLGLVAI